MIAGIFDFYDLAVFETMCEEVDGYKPGEMVIFKYEDGSEEIGKVSYTREKMGEASIFKESQKIIRRATPHDLQKFDANALRGTDAVKICSELVQKHKLMMYPFYAIYSLDGVRVNVVFTAEDRVDFRDLVKDLAKALQKQIHLKQIGPRDKARLTDGFGRCGRRFCCKGALPALESITMDMVRSQSLEGKGSSKLSGACGKLLCCLKYEVSAYKELRSGLPSIGSLVKLKKPVFGTHDEGYVIALDILNQKVKLDLGNRSYASVGVADISKVLKAGLETASKVGFSDDSSAHDESRDVSNGDVAGANAGTDTTGADLTASPTKKSANS